MTRLARSSRSDRQRSGGRSGYQPLTARCLPAALAYSLLVAAGVAPAAASDDPTWEPGNSTSANLADEAQDADQRAIAGGAHGRFDGDLDLAVAGGVEWSEYAVYGAGRVQAHYYSMAGAYVSCRQGAHEGGMPGGVASVGVDLRPVFLPRWALDLERGPVWFDLVMGSLSAAAGAWVAFDDGVARRPRPNGLELSFGAGLPLFGEADGPWLEMRYHRRYGGGGATEGSAWLMLSWHLLLSTPLADATGSLD